jgi:hypothetical protein
VLKLTEGVNPADETLRDDVVTPQLVQSFDQGTIADQVRRRRECQQGRVPARLVRQRQESAWVARARRQAPRHSSTRAIGLQEAAGNCPRTAPGG